MKLITLAVLLIIFAGLFSNAIAHPSWAIVVDDKNQIFVSDLTKIWKIDAAGRVSVFKEIHTHELRLDKDGNLLGEELNYNPTTQEFKSALWRITPAGQFSYTLAPTTAPPKGISIWKNRSGATYYFGQTDGEPRDYFLLKRNPNGNVKVLLGDERKALQQPQVVPYSFAGMTFAPDGSLYFKSGTTIWKADTNDRITVVADQAQLSAVTPAMTLFGLTLDAENNLYTADFNNKKVLKIAPDKKISVFYQSEKDWSPTGVYFRNGNLYVLENKNLPPPAPIVVRVQKIARDGKISTAATIGESQAIINRNDSTTANQFQESNQTNKSCAAIGLLVFASLILGNQNYSKNQF